MAEQLEDRDTAAGAEPYIWDHPFHFLTGAAGTGKTFLTRDRVRRSIPGSCVLMASTGIAAINLGDAVTINSQLGYFDTADMMQKAVHQFLQQKLRRMRSAGVRRLILDEVSMFDADQLTTLVRAVDDVNGEAVFGGTEVGKAAPMGLTLLGDFLQLPPVKGKFAFESPEWARFHVETLTDNRRQSDADFLTALRAARVGDADTLCDYFRTRMAAYNDASFDGTTILAKNDSVDTLNRQRHDALTTKPEAFMNTRWGQQRGEWKHIPVQLLLKPGARVMVLSNRYEGDGGLRQLIYANGDLATFLGKDQHGNGVVELDRDPGTSVPVVAVTREATKPLDKPRFVCRTCGKTAPDGRQRFCQEAAPASAEPCGGVLKKVMNEVVGEVCYMPLRLAYASTVHKCLLAGTRVPVVGRGLLPIEAVQVGDFVCSGQGYPCQVIAAQPTGTKELITVRFASGRTLHMSPDHPLQEPAGAFKVGVKVGQLVNIGQDCDSVGSHWPVLLPPLVQTPRGSKVVEAPLELSPKLAWWLGALLGDGSMRDTRDGTLEFHARDGVVVDQFCTLATRFFKVKPRRYPNKVYIISRAVRAWLYKLGLHYVTAASKTIPECIYRSPIETRAAFVQGLFDTDGCVDSRGLRYVSTSRALADGVQQLLDSLGLHDTRVFSQQPKRGKLAYTVHIRRKDMVRFADLIGFWHEERAAKLAKFVTKPVRELPSNQTGGTVDRIVEIVSTGLHVPLHDLEVDDAHSFIANGLVVSNTQGLTLDQVQIGIRDRFFASPGMLYVALSRCKTPEGLRLVGTVDLLRTRCTVDPRVAAWR